MGTFDTLFRDLAHSVVDLFTDTPVTVRRYVPVYDLAGGSPDLGATTTDFTRATGSFITDGFQVGDLIETSGFSNSGNNGTFEVTAVTALALTVVTTLIVETAGAGRLLVRYLDYTQKASPPYEFKLDEIDNDLVQRGDFKVIIAATDIAIEPFPKTDKLIRGGVVYKIINNEVLAGGDQNAAYILQCRR